MLSKIIKMARGYGRQSDCVNTIDRSRAVQASSDGKAHLEGSQFSIVIDDTEYEWDIAPLYQKAAAGDFREVSYEIPAKFAKSWYWGDTPLADHVERTLKADFSYPILVWDGQIVDGTHRCCLALAAGLTHVKAYEIINMPPYDRSYTAKPAHRAPDDPERTHAHVVREVNGYMFTPLPIQPLDPNNTDHGREDP